MTRLEVSVRPTARTAASAEAAGYSSHLVWVQYFWPWTVDAVIDPIISGDFDPNGVGILRVTFACTRCTVSHSTWETVKFFTNLPGVHYPVVCADCQLRRRLIDQIDREHRERNEVIDACNAQALCEGRRPSLVHVSCQACDIHEDSELCRYDPYLNF